jgi:hypothetical protein
MKVGMNEDDCAGRIALPDFITKESQEFSELKYAMKHYTKRFPIAC